MGLYYIDADTTSFFDMKALIDEAKSRFYATVGKKADSIYMSQETFDMLFGANPYRSALIYFGLNTYIKTKTPFGMMSLGYGIQHI